MPDNMPQSKRSDWILVAAITIVSIYHVRQIIRILANPEIRKLFIEKLRKLIPPDQPEQTVLDHIEPIGSTWLKKHGF